MNIDSKYSSIVAEAKKGWESLCTTSKTIIFIGTATCGRSAGALETWGALEIEAKDLGLDVEIYETGCVGICYAEPVVTIFKPGQPGIVYGEVDPKKVGLDKREH